MRQGSAVPEWAHRMSKVVVLAGEGEYESDATMRAVASIIGALPGAEIDYRTPDVLEDWPNFPESSFGGLETLRDADLLVMYTRFRVLPDSEIAEIAGFLERGGSLLALRTSTHAFRPVETSAWLDWTSTFGQDVLGSAWTRHHGHTSTTDVTVVDDHPIVAGLPRTFHVDSWLYETAPPPDALVLLWGDPVDPEEGPVSPSPVAWVREARRQRIFYTSLGSQSDLVRGEVLTLLANAAEWCLQTAPLGAPS
jgi:type 1 glutamine amidotransferase